MAFKIFDKDGSGKISVAEIKEIFGGAGRVTDKVWQDLVKEVDKNGDGEISYLEFKKMMLKLFDD